MVEHEAYTAAGAERAAALGEVAADIGHGPGIVVSGCFHEECNAERAVSLECNLLEIAESLVGGLLDGPLDIVLRHILVPGLCDEGTETRVADNIRSALLYGDGDFLSNLGEGLGHVAPTLHLPFFSELKCSSHIPKCYLDAGAFSILLIYLSISYPSID